MRAQCVGLPDSTVFWTNTKGGLKSTGPNDLDFDI